MEKGPDNNQGEQIGPSNYDRICDTKHVSTTQVWVTGLTPHRKLLPDGTIPVQRVRKFKAADINSIALNPDEFTGRIKHGRKITILKGSSFEIYYEYIHPESPINRSLPYFRCYLVVQDSDELT